MAVLSAMLSKNLKRAKCFVAEPPLGLFKNKKKRLPGVSATLGTTGGSAADIQIMTEKNESKTVAATDNNTGRPSCPLRFYIWFLIYLRSKTTRRSLR